MSEMLVLKWGTLKGWDCLSDKTVAILQRWANLGVSGGAASQRDTDQQKRLICEAIDSVCGAGGVVHNDWSGENMTAEDAKQYVMGYGK